jgi:hypothetical protein
MDWGVVAKFDGDCTCIKIAEKLRLRLRSGRLPGGLLSRDGVHQALEWKHALDQGENHVHTRCIIHRTEEAEAIKELVEVEFLRNVATYLAEILGRIADGWRKWAIAKRLLVLFFEPLTRKWQLRAPIPMWPSPQGCMRMSHSGNVRVNHVTTTRLL